MISMSFEIRYGGARPNESHQKTPPAKLAG